MLLSSSLRNVEPSAAAARTRTRKSLRQCASFPSQTEALEERRLLSTYTSVSVRDLIADINAVNSAGGSHTIILAPGTTFELKRANNTTDGANGLPVIGGTKAVDLTIVGNGDTIERVGGRTFNRKGVAVNPFRLFNVARGASLTLDQVTLKGGWAYGSDGGAIYNRGTLKVTNGSVMDDNQASNLGGGIYNAGGTVTISHSTLSNSRARDGGGIFSDGGVTVSGSTISGNLAVYGGGICNLGGTLTITSSTLSRNYADGLAGGGIYNGGGTVTVSNSAVSDNVARDGGGIFNNGGTMTITSSTISRNYARWDYNARGGYGGGIYNNAGAVTLSNSIISGNGTSYFGGGGGIYNAAAGTVTVRNASSITGNTSGIEGGAPLDVNNLGVVYLDSTSTIDVLTGNAAILI